MPLYKRKDSTLPIKQLLELKQKLTNPQLVEAHYLEDGCAECFHNQEDICFHTNELVSPSNTCQYFFKRTNVDEERR